MPAAAVEAMAGALEECATLLRHSAADPEAPVLRVFLHLLPKEEELRTPGPLVEVLSVADGGGRAAEVERGIVVRPRALQALVREGLPPSTAGLFTHPLAGYAAAERAARRTDTPSPAATDDSLVCGGAALLLAPGNDHLWGQRRRAAEETISRLFGTAPNAAGGEAAQVLFREMALCDAVQSFYHKIPEAWVHRGWCVARLASLSADACDTVRGCLRAGDGTFMYAAAAHPHNYNAWAYRRRLVRLAMTGPSPTAGPPPPLPPPLLLLLSEELRRAMSFARRHPGDSSAAAYLFSLVEMHEEASAGAGGAAAGEAWGALMALTQAALRTHAERGHECLWTLRLALVTWAAAHAGCRLGGWTVADELAWVSAHTEVGGALCPSAARWQEAAVECCGSLSWHSYYACRYGLALLRLLRK